MPRIVLRKAICHLAVALMLGAGVIVSFLGTFIPMQPGEKNLFLLVCVLASSSALIGLMPLSQRVLGGMPGAFLLGFVIVTLISCLVAIQAELRGDEDDIWRYAAQALAPAMAYWGCYSWSLHQFSIQPVIAGVGVILFVSVLSVVLEATGIASYEYYGSRYFGFIGDSVAWLIGFASIFFLVRRSYVIFSVGVAALLLTQSRGALVVLVFAAFVYFSFANKKVNYRAFLLLVVVLFPVLLVFDEFLYGIFDRFLVLDVGDNDRLNTIIFTYDVFSQFPLTGLGYGAHTYIYQESGIVNDLPGSEVWGTATSTWFQVLADSGVLGFLFFLVFIVFVLKESIFSIRYRLDGAKFDGVIGLSVWLIAYLPLNQTASWLLPGSLLSPIVFSVAGIVAGVSGASRMRLKDAVCHVGEL